MDHSFLFEFCDIRINYSGCSNSQNIARIDLVLIVLFSISILTYGVALILRVYNGIVRKKLSFKQAWNPIDTANIMVMLFMICRVLVSRESRNMSTWDPKEVNVKEWVYAIQRNIVYELFYYIFGTFSTNVLLVSFVKSSCNADIFGAVKIGNREVDPTKYLKLIRLCVLLQLVTYFSLWATLGTQDLESFKLYRKMSYLTIAAIALLISFPVLTVFSRNLFQSLQVIKQINAGRSIQSPIVTSSALMTNEDKPLRVSEVAALGRVHRFMYRIRSEYTKFQMLVIFIRYVKSIYLFTGLSLVLLVFFTEFLQNQPDGLFYLKIFVEIPTWAVTSFGIYYMVYRLF